ncbi:GAF domain-containing sensor histidine kinase [soil metagenome]
MSDVARERLLLLRIIDTVASGLELEQLAQGVAELITEATNTDVCFVHVLDADRGVLTLTGATPPFDAVAGQITLALGEGVTGWVAATGHPTVLVDDKEADPRYRYITTLQGERFTSMASVPMISRPGALIGVLNVHTVARRRFADDDIRLLSSIGSLVAGAIESARLHRKVAEREQARERFAERIVAVQEGERRRLAAEIHDGISQRIVGLAFHLSAASDAIGSDPVFAAQQVLAARALADDALDETRVAIGGLRPSVLDDLGLGASIASLGRSVPNVQVEVDVDVPTGLLAEHVETALYRITQEALQNVGKHAAASTVQVCLRSRDDGGVALTVSDDGCGFAPDERGRSVRVSYGLPGMGERASLIGGSMTVRSEPGVGTVITVTVPAGQTATGSRSGE